MVRPDFAKWNQTTDNGAETPWTPGNGKPPVPPRPTPNTPLDCPPPTTTNDKPQPAPAETANNKPAASPRPTPNTPLDCPPPTKANDKPDAPTATLGFAAMREACVPEPIQMFRLKVGDIVSATELDEAIGFFTELYLTSKRAKLGNGVTVSKNPEHLSTAELQVMCDRMSADPEKYAKLWGENKTKREFA